MTTATPAARSPMSPGVRSTRGADLVADAVGVLDVYEIAAAHVVGRTTT